MNAPASSAAEVKPENIIAQAVRSALDRTNGIPTDAAKLMARAVRASPRLRDAVTEPLIDDACYSLVCAEQRRQRADSWQRTPTRQSATVVPLSPRPSAFSDAATRERSYIRMLMEFPLPNGKRLADATKADLARAAEFYAKQAGDMSHKARWLSAIAAKVTEDKTVRDVLSEAEIAAMQQETANG